MIRIGLIGAGGMGGVHAACYEELSARGDCRVVAVADVVAERADAIAERFSAATYRSGLELIEHGGFDVVDICLPTYLHAQHALAAMAGGFHVFLEKPVCLHESEATQLLEAKRRSGVHVAVGHCIRFWPEYVYLKNLVDEQTYGNLLHASFTRIGSRPTWSPWFMDESKSGLAVLDLHIHDVDYVRYILGEPPKIACELLPTDPGAEHIYSVYRYPATVVAIEGSWCYPPGFPFEMAFRAGFERAAVTYRSSADPTLHVYTDDGTKHTPALGEPGVHGEPKPPVSAEGGNLPSHGGHFYEIRYVVDCLNRGVEPDVLSLEEAVASFRLTMRELALARGGA